jgi:hypothetical protein
MLEYSFPGTHGILSACIMEGDIHVSYSGHFNSSGALISFVYKTENGVNLSRSSLQAVKGSFSRLPFDLYPGRYRVYVYDIEQNGTLSNGVGYPAVDLNDILVDSPLDNGLCTILST